MSLTNKDVSIVLGMANRGDPEHNIAAWFGVNQGRVAEAKKGSHGQITPADEKDLPPKGPPGIKGKRVRFTAEKVLNLLNEKGAEGVAEVKELLATAIKRYDAHEA